MDPDLSAIRGPTGKSLVERPWAQLSLDPLLLKVVHA